MITPILLSGGAGTRLWPLSRKSYPKQFTQLIGAQSLFQETAGRFSGPDYGAPLVLTGSDFRFIVTEQLQSIGQTEADIVIEPEAKNSAPAVMAAALWLARTDPDRLMLVTPTDQVIPDIDAFHRAVDIAIPEARAGQMVTFGITPDRPETGFGYLELAKAPDGGAVALSRFVEKPDEASAKRMIASGNFLWNAGIFLFAAKTIIEQFELLAPELSQKVRAAVAQSHPDLNFTRLAAEPWAEIEDISIDYAIMEKAQNLSVVPFSGKWSDMGGWEAVWRDSPHDERGVASAGPVTSIDCQNSLLRSEDDALELVGIGLENTIVIATPDAVLVADRSRAQDVKKAVLALKSKGAKQATEFPRDHRPWGYFETLALSDRFQVKRIVVKPGASLSLQSHVHRSEHWVVVSGTARVTVNDNVELLSENRSVYIPLGAVHRMENPGKVPMVLIEVQTGSYLGEDDIIRYEDAYARTKGAKG